jgi:hypothetical protein
MTKDALLTVAPEPVREETTTRRWSAATRIAFRFCFVYFGLYVLTTQMLGGLTAFPNVELPPLEEQPPIKNLVTWVARHVFGIRRQLVITGSGSGDKTFNWVAALCFLIVALIATVVWSVLNRRREEYVSWHKWFHVFLRFAAGSTMLTYGMIKAFPLQMPAPSLTRLLEPFGDFSPMGVLWTSIGASRAYERFAGCAELAAAVCLFIPGLSLVGALILLADSIQIFALNMTYDVPVKLFSFHLILISLVLIAPDARRLLNLLILNRPASASAHPPLFQGARGRRLATAGQVIFAAYLIGASAWSARQGWDTYGGGAPKPALYGIWEVNSMTIDGVERPPLLTDSERVRRVIVPNARQIIFQRMDNTFVFYPAPIDDGAKMIVLAKMDDPKWSARLTVDHPDAAHLSLDGDMDGRQIRLLLQLADHSRMRLLNRGFNWVQEYPFNR